MKKTLLAFGLLFCLAACGGPGPKPPAPGVKLGKPYSVDGTTYTPEYDPHYDRTGMASWYGPGFHGGKTANGERFDQEELTAAHPTLPMPSLVRVTNLENGRGVMVRVNDRGPFKDRRLIDLSRASAQALGINGLARVRVQYLKEETEQYWASRNLQPNEIAFAHNDPYAPGNADTVNAPEPVQLADDAAQSQVKSAAPILSVASADLQPTPQELKIRLLQPRFRVIGEAEAKEALPPEQAEENETDTPVPRKVKVLVRPSPSQPKVVHLYDGDGQRIAPAAGGPKIVRLEAARVDTSSEGGISNEPAEENLPAPLTDRPAATGSGWYIQAGSFASENNANALANRLSALGGTDTATVHVNGAAWHRVRLGPFADRGTAESALAQAESRGATGARIIRQ